MSPSEALAEALAEAVTAATFAAGSAEALAESGAARGDQRAVAIWTVEAARWRRIADLADRAGTHRAGSLRARILWWRVRRVEARTLAGRAR